MRRLARLVRRRKWAIAGLLGGGAAALWLLPAGPARWMATLGEFASLTLTGAPMHDPGAPPALRGMPLTFLPARGSGHPRLAAILYSGDGGWSALDQGIAERLASAGVPVAGVDSLAYFWKRRTPSGAARDLAGLMRTLDAHWDRPQILLVGYSFGANALPEIVGALDPADRRRIARLALLGLGPRADFRFHVGSWLDISGKDALPTVPAIARLRGLPMLCIRGADEAHSACPDIPAGTAEQVVVPGGHHFDGNAALLAHMLLGETGPAGARR